MKSKKNQPVVEETKDSSKQEKEKRFELIDFIINLIELILGA
jgi:hypothetical protein